MVLLWLLTKYKLVCLIESAFKWNLPSEYSTILRDAFPISSQLEVRVTMYISIVIPMAHDKNILILVTVLIDYF